MNDKLKELLQRFNTLSKTITKLTDSQIKEAEELLTDLLLEDEEDGTNEHDTVVE